MCRMHTQKLYTSNTTKQMRKHCRCDYSTISRKCENKIIVLYDGLWIGRMSAAHWMHIDEAHYGDKKTNECRILYPQKKKVIWNRFSCVLLLLCDGKIPKQKANERHRRQRQFSFFVLFSIWRLLGIYILWENALTVCTVYMYTYTLKDISKQKHAWFDGLFCAFCMGIRDGISCSTYLPT